MHNFQGSFVFFRMELSELKISITVLNHAMEERCIWVKHDPLRPPQAPSTQLVAIWQTQRTDVLFSLFDKNNNGFRNFRKSVGFV